MVSPVAAPSAGLDTLLARPPTPPRERQNDIDAKSMLDRHPLASRLTLQTPPSHSPGSALSTNASTRQSRKRVEFTVPAENCDAPIDLDKENEHKKSTPASARSSLSLSRPLKSILKQTASPTPSNHLNLCGIEGETTNSTTLATMLESTIKHLAGNDRDSKIDAYTMLVRALRASTNLPDRIALQSKIGLFVQFIQRDVTAKGETGAIDSSLINHSLTLLSTFLRFPAMATAVNPDFGVFIIDHCIRSFEDPAIPKDVVRHLMQVVVCQDFPPKVMTADRVGRLVASLHRIEDHIKGKSIIMSRILIYHRLVKQSMKHMITHSEWLQDLFTDMLSSLKEIRSAAIALGLEASFTVAKERSFTKNVMDILQMSVDETRYADYYIQRLIAMTKEKTEMAAVPQIWSVVILLLRCPIDRWEFFDQWLEIIQRCFNGGDYQTKLEAHYAWNRLVYALHLYESSFSKTIGTLCQPLHQLRRKSKQTDELRKVIIGGICNLYYYAFKPNSSSTRIDGYWDACVRPLMRILAFPEADGKLTGGQHASSSDNLSQAATILAGLFDSSSIRLWKEDRIADNPLVKPAELPPLDPKWIRRNTPRVFSLVEPILTQSFLDLADPESGSSKLWRSLVGAVAAAASKEVKVATDTVAFLGNALSLFMRVWTTGLGKPAVSTDIQQSFLKATEAYLTTMILLLGHLPFTEKLLLMNKQKSLVPAATPSHRSGKSSAPTRSPLHHLFSILSISPPGVSDEEKVSTLFRVIFEPFTLTRSLRGRKDLARELMQISPLESPAHIGPWIFIAEALSTSRDITQDSNASSDSSSQSPIGHDFRDLVKHLEKGIGSAPNPPWPRWSSLFEFTIEQATKLSGEAGCSLVIIEPLAKGLLEGLAPGSVPTSINLYKCGVQLISNARQPRDQQALDAAKRRLWGTTVAGGRSASFDPFDNFYRLTSHLLETSYKTMEDIDQDILVSLITETSNFLCRSNQVLALKSLAQLQQGLGLWVQDLEERYSSKQRSAVDQAVKLLWDRICNIFSETRLGQFQLDNIEQLLCCGFQSKHRHIVNHAVLLWNQSFENVGEIQYPDALKAALLDLRRYVDIVLPGLDIAACNADNLAPSLVDSQDETESMVQPDAPSERTEPAVNLPPFARHLETPKLDKASGFSLVRSPELGIRRSGSARLTRSATRNRESKLRHDDSQIQFATIESSPTNREIESQALTDRQKEVRNRQLENASLFPTIRGSPRKAAEGSISISRRSSPRKFNIVPSSAIAQSVTPKASRSYDYVSSTPTPRRGQHSIIDEDHEMTDDVPSSPPEPRRNLLPEMKSHSRDTHLLADLPVSSSPVSGSPVSKAHLSRIKELQSHQEIASAISENESMQQINMSMRDRTITILGDAAYFKREISHEPPEPEPGIQQQSSPTNIRQLKDRSFEMSDDEERSMARLVIELDSKRCDLISSYGADSPEKASEGKGASECIAAHVGAEQNGDPSVGDGINQSPPPSALARASPETSQMSDKRLEKRKRMSDQEQNVNGKRRRHKRISEDRCDAGIKNRISSIDNDSPLSQSGTGPAEDRGATEEAQVGCEMPPLRVEGSPDLSYQPENHPVMDYLAIDEDSMDSDTAAVSLQLITEASQQSEVENHTFSIDDDASDSLSSSEAEAVIQNSDEMDVDRLGHEQLEKPMKDAAPQGTRSALERITTSLREGLDELRIATLSREDVYKIEDMFMDIKKELYEAERRSRG